MWLIWGNWLIFSREFKSYLPIYRYQSMWAVWFSPVQNCASFISRVIIILCHWGIACFVFNAKAISSVIICTFSQDNKATNVNFHACKTSQNLLEMTEVKSDQAYDSKHLMLQRFPEFLTCTLRYCLGFILHLQFYRKWNMPPIPPWSCLSMKIYHRHLGCFPPCFVHQLLHKPLMLSSSPSSEVHFPLHLFAAMECSGRRSWKSILDNRK